MSTRRHPVLNLVVLVLAVCAHAQQSDYRVSQRLRLTTQATGVDGTLEVLTDSRITNELRKEMWGNGDWSFALTEQDPRYSAFITLPPRNASLRIVASGSHPRRSFKLERPLARVTEAHVASEVSSFLVTVDYSVGFGSYAGLTTFMLEIMDGQIRWAKALDSKTKRVEQISLPMTLKSAWKLVPSGANQDIVQFYCRPNFAGSNDDKNFLLHYVRFHFVGKQWIKYERLRKGFWESGEAFPPLSKFP